MLVIADVWDQCARDRGSMFLGRDGDAAAGVWVCLSVLPALCSPSSDAKMPWSKWMPGIVNVARREGRAQTAALPKLALKNAILWAQKVFAAAGSC